MSFVVGLSGGIGSGKSSVAAIFAELGAAVVDADVIAHELTAAGGAAIAPIRAAFGEAAIAANGALDRAAMRAQAFAQPAVKTRLEAILHPLIRAESVRRAQAAQQAGAPYVVMVIPLLVESGDYRQRLQRVAVVDCSETTQVARTMARSGLTAAEVRAIMEHQVSRAERLAAADDVIGNEGESAALRPQVERLHRLYLQLARDT